MFTVILSYGFPLGPPLPPNVSLQLVNWSAIQLSWDAPFSMNVFPILKYTVNTTNATTGEQVQIDIEPVSNEGHIVHTIQETPKNCHQLQFEVFSINSVGASAPGTVSGGFPVGKCVRYCCCTHSPVCKVLLNMNMILFQLPCS